MSEVKSFNQWMVDQGFNAIRHANCCRIAYEGGQQSMQAEIDRLNSVLDERTKEWLQAIECGTYFENVAKPLKTEIDQLKAELALCREENKGLVGKVSEQRQINKSQLNKLINKSVRLTDAEFEYKRIRGLQAKDCLQIMRLTARNEKLNNELKTMRGVNDINLPR